MRNIPKLWDETTLGNVIQIYDHKRVPLSVHERNKRPGPYPYYGASGIIDYVDDYLFDGRYLLVSEDGANLLARKTPIAFFASGKFWVNNHAHIIRGVDGELNDYFLKSYLEVTDISGYVTGTAQPKLSQQNLKAIKILLPPYQIQRKIADVLSAYDDLIENNTRRIAILEEMAQLLYREWFVHFRFPGHEDVEMVESELGLVPEGWEVVPVKQLVKLHRNSLRPTESPEEDFAYYSFSAFDEGGRPLTTQGSEIKSNKYSVLPQSVLLSKLNPRIRRIWLPYPEEQEHRAVTSTEFLVLTPRSGFSPVYLYCFLNSAEFQNDFVSLTLGTSTSHQRVKPRDFMSMRAYLPRRDIIEMFTSIAEDLFTLRQRLMNKNQVLRETRDLLLPRLVSGELDVSGMEVIGQQPAV
jgi:type I restriction enzyme S subunit